MKRDMDLLRELLLEIEEKHDGSGRDVKLDFDRLAGSASKITEHLFLLDDKEYI